MSDKESLISKSDSSKSSNESLKNKAIMPMYYNVSPKNKDPYKIEEEDDDEFQGCIRR